MISDEKPDQSHENVVDFEEQVERIRRLKEAEDKKNPTHPTHQPLFNLPPFVKILSALMLFPYIAVEILGIFNPEAKTLIYMHFGFIPAHWSDIGAFVWYDPLTLITYNFLHGSILHIIMNLVMMLAFASGVEKFIGGKRMLLIFFISSFAGAFSHYFFNLHSDIPVIGASAGLSGLFGALVIMMQQKGMMGQKASIVPFVILWVVASIIFGSLGSPDGQSVAWIAHLGGFFAGLGLMRLDWFRKKLYF